MLSDEALLEAWREGDQGAGSELLRRYFKPLFNFFSTKVDHSIDDLIQRTLLACIAARDRIRDAPNFRAFVYGVARHELFRHFRLSRRDDGGGEVPSVVDLGTSPTGRLVANSEAQLLLQALRRIPMDHQTLIELFYWEQLTGPEIASVLDVPEGTVRTRLRKARQLLGEALEQLELPGQQIESTLECLSDWAARVRQSPREG